LVFSGSADDVPLVPSNVLAQFCSQMIRMVRRVLRASSKFMCSMNIVTRILAAVMLFFYEVEIVTVIVVTQTLRVGQNHTYIKYRIYGAYMVD